MKLKQFDVWLTDLEPSFGSEQGGKRPVMIIETNGVSGAGNTTIAIPISSRIEKLSSLDIVITPTPHNGLSQLSKLLFRQIRTIDKARLVKHLGRVEKDHWDLIRLRLRLLFDLDALFEND